MTNSWKRLKQQEPVYPQCGARCPAELLHLAKLVAQQEEVTLSQLVREAIIERCKASPSYNDAAELALDGWEVIYTTTMRRGRFVRFPMLVRKKEEDP